MNTFLLIIPLIKYATLLVFGVFVTAAFIGILNTGHDIFILTLVSIVLSVIQSLCLFRVGFQAMEFIYPFITHLPLALFLSLYYKKRPIAVTLGIFISYLCCQVINWLTLLFSTLGADENTADLFYTVLLILYGYFLIRHVAKYVCALLEKPVHDLLVFYIVPAVYYIYDYLSTVYTDLLYSSNKLTVEFLPFVISTSFLIFCIVYFKEYEQRTNAQRDSQILKMQMSQYENLCERMEQTRRARHDLRQHLRLIQSYIDTGDQIALRDYLSSYKQTLPDYTEHRFCENEVTNTVLQYYAQKAEDNAIHFNCQLIFPKKLSILDPDLCVLIGNLLENSLESCALHTTEVCSICINGQLRGSRTLVITVDNTPANKPCYQKGLLLSSKHDGTGTGTSSILSITKRYNGDVNFKWENGTFYSSVILTLPIDK